MNIIITGASTGIGYETALRFASVPENNVIVMARRSEPLQQLATTKVEGRIIPLQFDLAVFDYNTLSVLLQQNGITHIDILIHNAGLLINKPFSQLTVEDWETVYRVNVTGVAMLTSWLLPVMGGSQGSHIVMISSMGGVNRSLKFKGLSAYSSSKGALITLTECLATELTEQNISVNCLALGSVQTEMLTKAFPGYTGSMTSEAVSRLIFDFAVTGRTYFNGKIIEVSTTNP